MPNADYDIDVAAWSQQQSVLLRRRASGDLVSDTELDWPHIAEEIESVSISERSALRSHIATVLEHLIRLQASPATERRNGWKASVLQARGRIRRTLRSSPGLRREVAAMIRDEIPDARQDVAAILALDREEPLVAIQNLTYTEMQVLEPWFPDEPPPPGASSLSVLA